MINTQDKLKNFSEEQLVKEMQQPTGSAPQFMVLGEIERRKRMRADAKRQEGLMQPTVAQEAVSAAGVPQQGIAQVAQSLAPKTDMTQNTGVPNVQATQLPGQPNQPQRMADGGILRLAPGGGISGGTISAIARLKVLAPKIYEQYKDDPEMLALAAEYVNTPSNDLEKTGLESIEAPYVDPYGPQGLAQRTAGAEVGNQARMASAAAQQREVDRMLGINAPIGSGRQGAPLDAEARRRIAEEDMAMAVPVPRNDFRTFPGPNVQTSAGALSVPELAPFLLSGDSGVSRDGRTDEKILADAQAAIKRYSTGAGRDAEGNLLPVAPEQPFDYGARRDAEGNLLTVAPDYELTNAIEAANTADSPFLNVPRFNPDSLQAAVDRDRELSAISDAEDLRQRIAQEDAAMAVPIPQSGDVTVPRRPQAEGIASFGIFDPLVDRFKAIRSEDAARNAAASAGDADAFLAVGSQPQTTTGESSDGFSPMATAEQKPFTQKRDVINQLIDMGYVGDASLYRKGMVGQRRAVSELGNGELRAIAGDPNSNLYGLALEEMGRRGMDFGEKPFIAAQAKTSNAKSKLFAAQEPLRKADTLAAKRDAQAEIEAAQAAVNEAAAEQAITPTGILGTNTGDGRPSVIPSNTGVASINDAARMKEINEIPGQGVKTAAQQRKIAAALKTITDPTAMPAGGTGSGGTGSGGTSSGGTGSGGTNKKGGISTAKSKMDQDKWLALAQAGFTLMSTGDFGKAGSAGLAALQGYKKADREERKLDAELLLREAQLAAANRKGTTATKMAPASLVTAAASRLKTASDAMSSAVTPAQKQAAADEYTLALQEYNNLQRFVASQYGYTGGSTLAQAGPPNLSDSANKT